MNAYTKPTPEPSEATALHMRMLRRLAELGMELAELAATDAKALAQTPEPAAAHLPDPAPAPHPAAATPEPNPPTPSRPKDPILAFARMGRLVQQAIKLHTALEQGAKIPTNLVEHFADPRRSFLQEAITDIANNNPDLTFTTADAYNAIETRLAKDPEEFATLRTILNAVVADLGLPPTPQLSACMEGLIASLSGEYETEPPDRIDWYTTPQLE